MKQVTLITRTGCHLCEQDVDADPALRAEYSDRVPVILIDGREHGYWRVEEPRFRRAVMP